MTSDERPRRTAEVSRSTTETDVSVTLCLDGTGDATVETGVPVLNHFLAAWAQHGRFDIDVSVDGDTEIDTHHTIEDTAIVLGTAIQEALGDGSGITRFSDRRVPLDEAVGDVIIDVSGRPYFEFSGRFSQTHIGDVPVVMVRHFFRTLAMNANITLHLRVTGRNAHHEAEALFKSVGYSLNEATRRAGTTGVPSTKGEL